MKSKFTFIFLFSVMFSLSAIAETIVEHVGISETGIDVSSETIVGQITIAPEEAGTVIVHFNGTCISSPGDRILLAASNDGTYDVNDGHTSVNVPDADINRNSFSHTRVYDVTAGSQTFYASVKQSSVEHDGDGIVSVYASLTVEFIPSSSDVLVMHTGVNQTGVNADGAPVSLAEINFDAPSSGKVLVHFDGTCVSSPGDRIVMAASDQVGWLANDGQATVQAINADCDENSFSHSRSYDIASGNHTFYAVGESAVTGADGIIHVYGSLTVEFIPDDDPDYTAFHSGIIENDLNITTGPLVAEQIDVDAEAAGKVIVHFDGYTYGSPGDRIILAASDAVDWLANDGHTSVEPYDADLRRVTFSHTRVYDIAAGLNSFYALIDESNVETAGDGIASVYASLTVKYFPEEVIVEECMEKDQSQEAHNYGFWFDDSEVRWQEFQPTVNTLNKVDVYLHKSGSPGDVIVEIKDLSDVLLASETIPEAEFDLGWNRVDFLDNVVMDTESKYRIVVSASQTSASPDDRYFWRGSTSSAHDEGCSNDVIGSWPDYDYSFITYGCDEEIIDVEQNLTDRIQVFPNPAQKQLNISGLSAVTNISVYSLTGVKVIDQQINTGEAVIDISKLPVGVYIVEVYTRSDVILKKIIKE